MANCPSCAEVLPAAVDAYCPACREELPREGPAGWGVSVDVRSRQVVREDRKGLRIAGGLLGLAGGLLGLFGLPGAAKLPWLIPGLLMLTGACLALAASRPGKRA